MIETSRNALSPSFAQTYISTTYIPLFDSTRLTLYADDLLIYKPILTESSHLQLQGDINSISLWADNNLINCPSPQPDNGKRL